MSDEPTMEPIPTVPDYWKLAPWNQGFQVAVEASLAESAVRHQQNPYPAHSDNGKQWSAGYEAGRISGHV